MCRVMSWQILSTLLEPPFLSLSCPLPTVCCCTDFVTTSVPESGKSEAPFLCPPLNPESARPATLVQGSKQRFCNRRYAHDRRATLRIWRGLGTHEVMPRSSLEKWHISRIVRIDGNQGGECQLRPGLAPNGEKGVRQSPDGLVTRHMTVGGGTSIRVEGFGL